MRILVFSDSHGDTRRMHEVIQKEDFDMIMHLGDCYDDMEELKTCYDVPILGVIGNVDYVSEGPAVEFFQDEEIKIMLTHGHRYHVKSHLSRLRAVAKEKQVQIVLFGHTHEALYEEADIILMNPGSISRPRNTGPSYGILEINKNKISGKIVFI